MAHVLDHLRDLIVAQLFSERWHIAVPVVHCLAELGIGLLLNLFRAKIGSLQLFA